MIDYSLPYYGLLMLKSDFSYLPNYELPEGYYYCTYREGMKKDWVRIHTSAQNVRTYEEASKAFDDKILSHGELLKEYCVFICDEQGRGVANASLLPGYHFGTKKWQIYWVAVMPEHNGRHLCHALIAYLIELFCKNIGDDWMYLATQTWNYCAISVYKDLGFEPYLGPKPINWKSEDFAKCNSDGWKIVDEQIGKYVIKRFQDAFERCLLHARRGELCFPAAFCELRYDKQGDAELVFFHKGKCSLSPVSWNIDRMIVIAGENSGFRIIDEENSAKLKKIRWINIMSREPVSRPVSRQAFFVRMMGIGGLLLRGCFPIIRHGIYYGQLPYGDTESFVALRADLCSRLYDVLCPVEVTGYYDS